MVQSLPDLRHDAPRQLTIFFGVAFCDLRVTMPENHLRALEPEVLSHAGCHRMAQAIRRPPLRQSRLLARAADGAVVTPLGVAVAVRALAPPPGRQLRASGLEGRQWCLAVRPL